MVFLRVFLVCATACGMFNPGNRVASDFMSGSTLRGGRIVADAHPWFRSPRRTPRWAILAFSLMGELKARDSVVSHPSQNARRMGHPAGKRVSRSQASHASASGLMFFRASRRLSGLRRVWLSWTYFLISRGSVQACWRRAQPIAFWRKNSREPSEGSMQA